MPQNKKKKFPEPDEFTVAFREAMRSLRKKEIEEHIRNSPNAPKLSLPKVSTGQPNPEPIVDEGEVRRRADLILSEMELEKQKKMGAFSKKIESKVKKFSNKRRKK